MSRSSAGDAAYGLVGKRGLERAHQLEPENVPHAGDGQPREAQVINKRGRPRARSRQEGLPALRLLRQPLGRGAAGPMGRNYKGTKSPPAVSARWYHRAASSHASCAMACSPARSAQCTAWVISPRGSA
jgi:hypothetical protein